MVMPIAESYSDRPIPEAGRTTGERTVRYATLMVHLEVRHPNTALLRLAAGLAERFHAGVVGIAACQPMRILYNDGYVPSDIIKHDREAIETEIEAAKTEFQTELANLATTLGWRSGITFTQRAEYLSIQACMADLVITGVDHSHSLFETPRNGGVGDLVMRAGRPCLIVPKGIDNLPLAHAVVGWKNTAETRRAISDALPMLQAATRVSVVAIAARQELAAAGMNLSDVVGWLKQHGIEANAIVSPSTGDDAKRLDEIVREQQADLLVAGAYGHSRVREWALGGVTRDLLLRPQRCTLVSH
jgi:nucleotide-binding universal stress UspA family protein